MVVFTFWEEHRDGWRGAFWDTTYFSPSSGKSHTEAPSQLYACSKCAEMDRLIFNAYVPLRSVQCSVPVWDWICCWTSSDSTDTSEAVSTSRRAPAEPPSGQGQAARPSGLQRWSHPHSEDIIFRLKLYRYGLMSYQEIEGGCARGGEQRRR